MSQDKRRRRVVSYVVTGVALALVGGMMGAVKWANRPLLDEPIPPQVLPNPNAADYYKRASKLLVDAEVLKVNPSRPKPGDPPPPSARERAALVSRNAAALAELRKGLAYPCVIPRKRSLDAGLGHLEHCRPLARLLATEARTHADREDWPGAMSASLVGIQFGNSVSHGADLVGDLVGIACQQIARREAWDYASHLTAPQARRAAGGIGKVLDDPVPLHETLVEDRHFLLPALADGLKDPGWAEKIMGPLSSASDVAAAAAVRLYGPRRILGEAKRASAWAIEQSTRPYADFVSSPRPSGMLTNILTNVLVKAPYKHYHAEAENGLLAVTLALRAYKLEHGAYPDRLDRLVPEYLPRIPRDPYAASGPLSYRRDGRTYRLWSIGPDAHDDGGKAIDNPGKTGSRRRVVAFESKGDIVAGVNR